MAATKTQRPLTEAAKAAKAIRNELKEAGIEVVSVKSKNFAGGNSVDVKLQDAPPRVKELADEIADKYVHGHFDGMTDTYVHQAPRRLQPAPGQVRPRQQRDVPGNAGTHRRIPEPEAPRLRRDPQRLSPAQLHPLDLHRLPAGLRRLLARGGPAAKAPVVPAAAHIHQDNEEVRP